LRRELRLALRPVLGGVVLLELRLALHLALHAVLGGVVRLE
jgi:hypothetical protein